jgi:hypothetical protein
MTICYRFYEICYSHIGEDVMVAVCAFRWTDTNVQDLTNELSGHGVLYGDVTITGYLPHSYIKYFVLKVTNTAMMRKF